MGIDALICKSKQTARQMFTLNMEGSKSIVENIQGVRMKSYHRKWILGIISSIIILAISASAKNIVDTNTLNAKVISQEELIKETREDVKWIKNYLIESQSRSGNGFGL